MLERTLADARRISARTTIRPRKMARRIGVTATNISALFWKRPARPRVIGEDLGTVPDYVRPNLRSLGIAGFKIPQWGISSWARYAGP